MCGVGASTGDMQSAMRTDSHDSMKNTVVYVDALRKDKADHASMSFKYTAEQERLASLCIRLTTITGEWVDPLPAKLLEGLSPRKKMHCYHCSLCGGEKRGHQCPYAPKNMTRSAFFLVSAARSHKSLVKLRKAARQKAL